MATSGYAATSISDIRRACGLPPSSIYWHFGSKEGVLAAVMERGAERFFAAIPTDGRVENSSARRRAAGAAAGIPAAALPAVAGAQRRSGGRRGGAPGPRHGDRTVPRRDRPLTARRASRPKAERVVTELTAFAVALSDGIFLAEHLEPDATDVERMYRRLYQTVTAMIPILLEEK